MAEQKNYTQAINVGFGKYLSLLEILFENLSGAEVAEFGLHDRPALLHLKMVRPKNHAGIVVIYEHGARSKFIYV
jgi:hypothetical protein